MVKRFFNAVFRIAGLIIILGAAIWGAVQPFYQLPYGDSVNKWLLFTFSAFILWNIREFFWDFSFWGSEVKKSFNDQPTYED